MTRVLVAAASAVVRAGLETILRQDDAFTVVGTMAPSPELSTRIEELQPNVVLIDVERGDTASAQRLLALGGETGGVGVVLLTGEPEGTAVADAIRLGSRALLPRDATPEEIRAAVDATATGLVVLHPQESRAFLSQIPPSPRMSVDAPIETLTPREIEVLTLLAEGEGNKTIARRLGISEHTVKFHVGSILGKLNAASRTEAVTLGLRLGLIMV